MIRDTITCNVGVDFDGMIAVVTQSVEDLSKCEMWQMDESWHAAIPGPRGVKQSGFKASNH